MPKPICAVDGEESAAGITSSRSPNVRNRITRCNFILFSSCPLGLPVRAAPEGLICFKTWRRLNPQPAVCPDEGPAYLNTEDWSKLLGKKLFGMRNFRLLASPRVLGWVANRVTPTWRGSACGDASTRCSAIFEHDTVF